MPKVKITHVDQYPATGSPVDLTVHATVVDDDDESKVLYSFNKRIGKEKTKLITGGVITKVQAKKYFAAQVLAKYNASIAPPPAPEAGGDAGDVEAVIDTTGVTTDIATEIAAAQSDVDSKQAALATAQSELATASANLNALNSFKE